jgi:hypothetical protein
MNPKPPKSGRSGRRRLVGLAAVGVTVLGFAGAGLATAGSALADPGVSYLGVGSNTTQDAMNAYAALLGDGTLGSYDAVTPITGTTYNDPVNPLNVEIAPAKVAFGVANPTGTQTDCDFTRPNGSGAGVAALEEGVNPNFTNSSLPASPHGTTQEPGPGCIDFARSSNAPSTNANGDLLFIPFGGDVLATATGPATGGTTTIGTTSVTYLPTAITQANQFSFADMTTFYTCHINDTNGGSYTTVTVPDGDTIGETGSTTYYVRTTTNVNPPSDDSAAIPVDLYVPQSGSGTRNFWLNAVTLGADSTGALPACVNNNIVNASAGNTSFNTTQVEENDGTVYTVDPNALGPFSIAQQIAQSSGHGTNRLFAVATHEMGGQQPFTGTLGTNAKINPLYPVWRLVYNVVLAGRVLGTPGPGGTNGTTEFKDGNGNPDGKYDAGLVSLFAGTGSALCSNSILIGKYGFATLPQTTAAGLTVSCGDTSPAELATPLLTAGAPAGWTGF